VFSGEKLEIGLLSTGELHMFDFSFHAAALLLIRVVAKLR
jgi:hypothetical protein